MFSEQHLKASDSVYVIKCPYPGHGRDSQRGQTDTCRMLSSSVHRFWGDGQPEDDKDPDDDPIEEKCVILSWTDKHWDTVSCAGLYKRICESKAADWL